MVKLESNTNSKLTTAKLNAALYPTADNLAKARAARVNRGTLRRGYNKIITCHCCGHKTQSQIGSGTDLCQECYDFGGNYNSWQDGETKAVDLPQPVRCARCKQERAEAVAQDAKKAVETGREDAPAPVVDVALETHTLRPKPRYINIAAINDNGSPTSTQIWTNKPHQQAAERILTKWIADVERDGEHGHPLVTAVSKDTLTGEVLAYRADGFSLQRLDNLA